MKTRLSVLFALVVSITLLAVLGPGEGRPTVAQGQPAVPATLSLEFDRTQVAEALQGSPVMFIENVGQFDERARFQVRGGNRTVWLAEDALWITLFERPSEETEVQGRGAPVQLRTAAPQPAKGVNLKLSFAGANLNPRLEPFNRLDTHVSYFIGNEPAQWRADLPVWGGVRYVDLYPGVDLEVTSEGRHWFWRLVMRDSQFEISNVYLRVEGADVLALNDDQLHLTTFVGELSLPLLQAVTTDDVLLNLSATQPEMKGFNIRSPFSSAPLDSLTLYPQANPDDLLYSSFLGGSGDYDDGYGIALDGAGNAYITGFTQSYNFPATPGAFDTGYNGNYDVFVVKLDANGSDLIYATLLGGNLSEYGRAIAVDGVSSAYVTGDTGSSDFPATPGAFDSSSNGGWDAFLVKLNATGTGLVYSTFLGGSSADYGYAVAVDGTSNVYVTGYTKSLSFPTTPGAFDTSHNGGFNDVFVARVKADGTDLDYSTFLGGDSDDYGYAIAVDGAGGAYVTGSTWSSNFPTTPEAFDTNHNGGHSDVFLVKLNVYGTGLVYGTFLGGWSSDSGYTIAVDSAGNAYVAGGTESSNFPTTPEAFDRSCGTDGNCDFDGTRNHEDAFVAKLNTGGTALVYSTFLGGSEFDRCRGLAVDGTGNVYVTGYTYSSDFPTTPEAFDTIYNGGDAFVAKVSAGATELVYGTFLGGWDNDKGYSIAVDGVGSAYVTGSTRSSSFPTTPDAFDTSYNGGHHDAFVTKLAAGGDSGPIYSISGHVQDDGGNPISDGMISAGAGGSATTDAGGAYTITNVMTGTYTLTPSKSGYTFSPVTRTVSVPPDATGQDFTGNSEPTELVAKVQDLATSTNARLDQVLAEAHDIAQDGDYFAVAKKEDEIERIADAIIDSAGILANGFDAVDEVKSLTKLEFPGVIGRGWGHILDLKANHEVARNAFRDALQHQVTSANARRAAKEFFNGAHIFYAADMLDTAAEDLLSDGMVKYGWEVGLQSDLALQSRIYEPQSTLVSSYKQDISLTANETISDMPSLTTEEQQAYIEDLDLRKKANTVMVSSLEWQALPLHLARDDRENGQGDWITGFLTKYLVKGLLYLYAGEPGALAVDIGITAWDLYQNTQDLEEDAKMMNLAVEGMGGTQRVEKRVYLNTVHGMDNIAQRIEPQVAHGSVFSIVNESEGEYRLFGRWWWCEHSSYSEVNVSNSTSYDTVYQIIAKYGRTGFLGTSYQPLVSEGARAIPGGGSDTVLVYYKQDDEGASPDADSAIELDVLGSTDTGTYHIVHDGTTWQDPVRVSPSGGSWITTQDQADAPTISYPLRSRIAVDEDALTYTPYIWADNPFTETVVITLTQPLLADIQVIDANGGAMVENSLRWQRTITPGHTVEITHLVRYLGSAGQVVSYPEPLLEMVNVEATAYVTFTGKADIFISQPPLSAVGIPPAEIVQGKSVTIPITVTNRLVDEAASGTVQLNLIDFVAETEVYSDTQAVSVPAGGSQLANLVVDTIGLSEGDYLLAAVVESNGGQEEAFSEYLKVKLYKLYLPLILRYH